MQDGILTVAFAHGQMSGSMHGKPLDNATLSKSLADEATRRRAFGALGALALAGVGIISQAPTVSAAHHQCLKRCVGHAGGGSGNLHSKRRRCRSRCQGR